MIILLWRVLDTRLVEACLAPALWLFGLAVTAVLLPEGSGAEALAEFGAFWATLFLLCSLVRVLFAALWPSR